MKIMIAAPNQMDCPHGPLAFNGGTSLTRPPWEWHDWVFNGLYPESIREMVLKEIKKEQEEPKEGEKPVAELHLVTLNRTVLDMVKSSGAKDNVGLSYEDVFIFSNRRYKYVYDLVPLLEVHPHDWLCHFALGDLLERGEIP